MAKHRPNSEPAARTQTRCAIYTRKSTEEGLGQEFNSLDAQREACGAYVVSQRHEGWALLPEYYDDGGFSGGNMERPGLVRLLADVKAGKIDVVVVYKVDRLTRALSDFARIVDVLDGAGASFVSITQSFNTTTSMGRLTLNVLLSFAQFEREVISERVRDKVAASKRKGMWMGGVVPLGYDVKDRKLIVNESEAEIVRHIMRRYLEIGQVRQLQQELAAEGIVSKVQSLRNGRTRGGTPHARGALYHILSNQIYRGEIAYCGEIYPGEHDAIVPQPLWDAVQRQLDVNSVQRYSGPRIKEPSLLAGMIFDENGSRLTPSHTNRDGLRYRYYVSPGQADNPVRIAAGDVERAVRAGWIVMLTDHATLITMFDVKDGAGAQSVRRAADTLRAQSSDATVAELKAMFTTGGLRVAIGSEGMDATIQLKGLATLLGVSSEREDRAIPLAMPPAPIRRGHEKRLVVTNAESAPLHRDGRLLALIVKAQKARQQLFDGSGQQPEYGDKHLARMARLAFLAPDIIAAMLEGRQPATLTSRQLLRAAEIPLAWSDQRRMFGFS